VLVSERSTDRTRGRYQWDDLRRDTSLLDRLAAGPTGDQTGTTDDVILLEDDGRRTSPGATGVLTRTPTRVRVVPQGIFDLHELAARIAIAGNDEAAVIDAIRSAPRASVDSVLAETDWRVIVPCPVVEAGGEQHRVLFTGREGREPAIVYGTPAAGLDASVEDTAPSDLFPGPELARVERGGILLATAEVLIITGVLLATWASGALGSAARDHAIWLGSSLVLAASAVGFTLIPRFTTRDPEVDLNDVFEVRRTYASRTELIGWTSAISAVLFGVALIMGIGPMLDGEPAPSSSVSVTFDTDSSPVLATIQVGVSGAHPGDPIAIDVTAFAGSDAIATSVAHLSLVANEEGQVQTLRSVSMPPGDDVLSVSVTAGDVAPVCSPSSGSEPGCTIVAIPAATSGTSTSAPSGPPASVSVVLPAATPSP
jgi:hypothetical protein